jgi:hypothetical protein
MSANTDPTNAEYEQMSWADRRSLNGQLRQETLDLRDEIKQLRGAKTFFTTLPTDASQIAIVATFIARIPEEVTNERDHHRPSPGTMDPPPSHH